LPAIALLWLLLLSAPFTPLTTGAQGPQVAALQTYLQRFGDQPGPVDGHYGPQTAAGVRRFELSAGLPVDGVAGPALLAAVVDRVARGAPVLQEGSSGSAVSDLQSLLTADGVAVGEDGRFGPQTLSGVERLQQERGLAVDGVVGPETWSGLFTRTYAVGTGQTVDGLAQSLGVPASRLLAENGGSSLLIAGNALHVAYVALPAAPAPGPSTPAATTPAATTPASQPASSTAGSTPAAPSSTSTPTGGAAGTAARSTTTSKTAPQLWGGAGTPDLSIVAVAQDQPSALALRAKLPQGVVLALPAGLYALGGSPDVLLATSRLADVRRTGAHAVLWQGRLTSKVLSELRASHASVLIARPLSPAAALSAATGGGVLAVNVSGTSLAELTSLTARLQQAGYRLTPPEL